MPLPSARRQYLHSRERRSHLHRRYPNLKGTDTVTTEPWQLARNHLSRRAGQESARRELYSRISRICQVEFGARGVRCYCFGLGANFQGYTVVSPECGERHVFLTTSAKYHARKPVEGTSGIALGDGVEAARGTDGRGWEWGLFRG